MPASINGRIKVCPRTAIAFAWMPAPVVADPLVTLVEEKALEERVQAESALNPECDDVGFWTKPGEQASLALVGEGFWSHADALLDALLTHPLEVDVVFGDLSHLLDTSSGEPFAVELATPLPPPAGVIGAHIKGFHCPVRRGWQGLPEGVDRALVFSGTPQRRSETVCCLYAGTRLSAEEVSSWVVRVVELLLLLAEDARWASEHSRRRGRVARQEQG